MPFGATGHRGRRIRARMKPYLQAQHQLRGPTAPHYLVTVDGGGSGTRLRLHDLQGRVLGEGQAGPSALSLGAAQAWGPIAAALQQAAGQAGLPLPDWGEIALGLGLAGANGRELAAAFLAAQPGLAHIALDHDGITTVLGAHGGQPGAVIAAGTGTVGLGLRADGSRQLVSGFGFRWGDEGSGAWLGLQAMGLAQQALDGRRRAGALAHAVWTHCGGAERSALLAWCKAANATETAALAPLVFAAAAEDPQAERLLQAAARELAQVARALDARLPLALAGSIALRLAEHLGDRLPAALRKRRVAALGTALDGALYLLLPKKD